MLWHVPIVHSFLSAKYHFIVWIYNNLFIHSPTDDSPTDDSPTDLGCFQFCPITNNVAVNIMYRILSKYKFSFLLRVERLIRLVCIYLKRLPHCSPKWLYHFTSLLAVNESSSSSTSLSIFDIVRLFNFKYFNTSVVILICISLMTNNAKHL